jgi:hypothetical protein
MAPIDWRPDETKLKQFGWFALPGFGLIGAALGWRLGCFAAGEWLVPMILWGTGVLSAILAFLRPRWLLPLYLVLSAISAVIGPVVATVVMGVIFLLVFVPLGWIFRLRGRDELRLKPDPGATTYWETTPPPVPAKRYFRQF